MRSLETAIVDFIALLLRPESEPHVDRRRVGSTSWIIPTQFLTPGAIAEERTHFSLNGQRYLAFERLFKLLRSEQETEHVDDRRLDSELWVLTCEVGRHQ